MIKLFLFGLSGKMGQSIIECCKAHENIEVSGGFDIINNASIPTFHNIDYIDVPFDVIVDFSRPEVFESVNSLARRKLCPVVLATTGYDQNTLARIDELAKIIPLFISSNMSIGINVLLELVAKATTLLWDNCDVEIIEKHHNQKVDAPSGTALMIANAINEAADKKANYVFGREGKQAKRQKNDVGIHAVRGGTIVGEHEVLFCGGDEILTISHCAQSRKVLAEGAISAAKFICSKPNGKYGMKDLLNI